MISIVTPTMNAAAVLERNLSMMTKQRAAFEQIVQDGGSTDGTSDLVKSYAETYDVRFYQEPDQGIYDAVCKGMSKAKGEILGWLGADDYYLPWTLSTVEAVFAEYPNVGWIIGIPTLGFHDSRQVWMPSLAPVYLQTCIRRGYYRPGLLGTISQEAMFWRRSLWEKAKAADVIRAYRYAGDYHLWKAFAVHSPLRTVGTAFAVFSVSSQQASSKHARQYLEEIDPGESRPLRGPSSVGKLVNRITSLFKNGSVLRPGFDFAINGILT